jgi:hypothetical protein
VHTLGDPSKLSPLSEVVITPDPTAPSGMGPLTPEDLERLLAAGKPVTPGDPELEAWSYSPWCVATFRAHGQRWQVFLYLGGLGLLTDERGRKGMFHFEPPTGVGHRHRL